MTGVDMHIGSQITDMQPFDDAFALLADFVRELRSDGHVDRPRRSRRRPRHSLSLTTTIRRPIPSVMPRSSRAAPASSAARSVFEPGRLIVGNAGVLVTSVIYVKHGDGKNFVIVDAAMNDLIRPTLYDAHHECLPLVEPRAGAPRLRADIVGPVCESGDFLALDRDMAAVKAGDLLAVMSAGAYGAVQAGTYNTRLLVPETLVKGGGIRGGSSPADLRRVDRPGQNSALVEVRVKRRVRRR